MPAPLPPQPCLAVDLVRAGLDPLTGRTLSFSQLPRAVWAGHLCDLVLAGVLEPDVRTARPHGGRTPPLHPLLAATLDQLTPHLPTTWAGCFRPTVVDPNRTTRQVQNWLVATGEWRSHRTLFGPRYQPTSTDGRAVPCTASATPSDGLRTAVLTTLLGIARLDLTTHRNSVGRIGPDAISGAPDVATDVRDTVIAIITTTEDLIDLAHLTISPPNGL